MWLKNIFKRAFAVPIATILIDKITGAPVLDAMKWVLESTDSILSLGNSLLNPLFSSVTWWASAWLLTNSILKENKWMKKNKKFRLALSVAWWVAWLAWWATLAPYLVAWWVSYAVWKPLWKFWEKIVKSFSSKWSWGDWWDFDGDSDWGWGDGGD